MAQKQVQLKQPNYGNKKYVMIDNTKPIPKVHCGESLDLPL
jgi:hypothetical protein